LEAEHTHLPSGSESTAPSAAAVGVTPTRDPAVAGEQMQRHGFCILDGVIPSSAIPALRASAQRTAVAHDSWHLDGANAGAALDGSVAAWHVGSVLTYDQTMAAWIGDRRVLDVVEKAFATTEIKISYTTLQVNRPRCQQLSWHADGNLAQTLHYPPPNEALRRPAHINALYMLSDFTVANGGTWIVPGSHARPAAKDPYTAWSTEARNSPYSEAVHATGTAGCVCVIDCRIWHCMPPNRTDEPRVMVNVRYAPKRVPIELLVEPTAGQPPWPPMPQAVFEGLPAKLKPLYAHAPLPPPPRATHALCLYLNDELI
jgi:hypothetical protein